MILEVSISMAKTIDKKFQFQGKYNRISKDLAPNGQNTEGLITFAENLRIR